MANYIVNGDYWDMWGVSSEEEAIVDMDEIERLASEWGKPIEELLQQVDEAYEVYSTCPTKDGDVVISCDGAYYIGASYSDAVRILKQLSNGIIMRGEEIIDEVRS